MKTKVRRDGKYLSYIRAQACCICGSEGAQAAHVRIRGDGGMGLKPSDYRALPLCYSCHRTQHSMGELSFWEKYEVEPEVLMCAYMAGYAKDAQALAKVVEDTIVAQLEPGDA